MSILKRFIVSLVVLGTSGLLGAQATNGRNRPNGENNVRRTVPRPDQLTRMGQVATLEDAKPLIARYYEEQERLFQERREAILKAQGKTPAEGLEIMRTHVAAQKERRQKQRELEGRIQAMLKQDREEKSRVKSVTGNGR